jgi:squalene synthase HpnC
LTADKPSRITDVDQRSSSLHDDRRRSRTTGRRMTAHIYSYGELATLAREENFPVAMRLLPRDVREKLMAVYGFARLVDDVGDEATGDRLAMLDQLEVELERAASGTAEHPIFCRLSPVLAELDVGLAPFRSLIEANRRDQSTTSYETFDQLIGYCMLSAAPVGRIVLSIFDATSPARVARSDQVCIALQLIEHLQDVGEDLRRGRRYLPSEDLQRVDCPAEDLTGHRATPAVKRLIELESVRARVLLANGVPLAATLPARPRAAIAGFVGGGLAALDAIARADYDVLAHRCRPRKVDVARRALVGYMSACRGGVEQ